MKNILSLLLTIGCLFAQANPVTMLVEPIPKSRAGEVAEIVISMNMNALNLIVGGLIYVNQ